VDVGGLRLPSEREITAFLDGGLRHHHSSVESAGGYLNLAQDRLALAMADGSALHWTEVPPLSAGAAEMLTGVHAARVDAEQAEATRQRMQAERDDVQAALDRHLEAAAEAAGAKDSAIAALDDALAKARQHTEALQQQLDTNAAALNDRDVRIAENTENIQRRRRQDAAGAAPDRGGHPLLSVAPAPLWQVAVSGDLGRAVRGQPRAVHRPGGGSALGMANVSARCARCGRPGRSAWRASSAMRQPLRARPGLRTRFLLTRVLISPGSVYRCASPAGCSGRRRAR